MVNDRAPSRLHGQASGKAPTTAQTLSSEAVLDALKMILLGTSLGEILTSVVRLIESHSEGMLCSIFILEEDSLHLRYAAAPNLSEAFRAATDGLLIGPDVGSCGTAAYLRTPVFVCDITSDAKWAKFVSIALESGVRASWSSPIISHDGKLLGTFGMHYREVREPGPSEIQLIEHAGRIAGIAIERDRSRTALATAFEKIKKAEAEFRQIVDAISQKIIVLSPEGSVLYVNKVVLEYTGYSIEDAMKPDFRTKVFHPEDLTRLEDQRRNALARGLPFEYEQRALSKEGKYRWFLIRFKPLRDEHGSILRWYATGTDIEDRRQAEQRTRNENLALREELDRSSMYEAIVGSSEALRGVLSQVASVRPETALFQFCGRPDSSGVSLTIHYFIFFDWFGGECAARVPLAMDFLPSASLGSWIPAISATERPC